MTTTPPNPEQSTTSAGLIKIEVGGVGEKSYKSIDNLTWDNVPGFAILTGLNGVGKTQLLELLAYRLTDTLHPRDGHAIEIVVTITGDKYASGDIAYLPASGAFAGDAAVGIAQMQNIKREIYDQLQPHNIRQNIQLRARRARLERFFGVSDLNHVNREDFIKGLPDDYTFLLEDEDVITGLAHHFVAYRLRYAERLKKSTAG